ncbi:MAG: class I SAM-dependent methyltransferase [Vicinamibacterales bacterium]
MSNSDSLLRVSPNFVLAFASDGRSYVAKDSEPYEQFWLCERERLLHFVFATGAGASAAQALGAYYRLARVPESESETARVRSAIRQMRDVGVLVDVDADRSRYTAAIVDDYLAHRPFPGELAAHIIRSAPVTRGSRVLDLAGGPGDLALALAGAADDVSLIDLSLGFVQAAASRAAATGRRLTAIHESCNRLVYRDDEFDVITISQALHWLDDVMVCRGVCRVLRDNGSFFVVHASIDVADDHPLALVIGRHSIFGHKTPDSFEDESLALRRRLTGLFDALDAPGVHRIDRASRGAAERARVVPAAASLFTQRRPFGLGYVNAFLTDVHIAAGGREPDAFRRELAERVAGAAPDDLIGTQHWAVLRFTRGGTRIADDHPHGPPVPIGFAPADAAAGII